MTRQDDWERWWQWVNQPPPRAYGDPRLAALTKASFAAARAHTEAG